MKEQIINWDNVPDILSKDDFYRICHISKSTALHLLRNGKVPCEFTGKKTRCYQTRKEDVQTYLAQRAVFPELYSAPQGWYSALSIRRSKRTSRRHTEGNAYILHQTIGKLP